MGITRFMLERKVFVYFFAFLLAVGGPLTFLRLGQLEDPDFTVKTAVIVTDYPGAEPDEVELEVTDVLERAIQEVPALDMMVSWSRAGRSLIKIEIQQQYWSDRLPQVWDDVRKKIRDVTPRLPPGAGKPVVSDDFSFVFGFVLAITGDGFSYGQLEDYANDAKKELSIVPGVSRVDIWGVQDRVIYLDVNQAQLAALGLTAENIRETLRVQNLVVDAGSVDVGDRRLRVAPSGAFTTPEEIGDLAIRPMTGELVLGPQRPGTISATAMPMGGPQYDQRTYSRSVAAVEGTQLIRIKDIAEVRVGYMEPPRWKMRFQGQPALAICAANVAGGNVVETGRRLDQRTRELLEQLPVGIELHKVAWQSDLVTSAIDSFMISLAEAVAIVLVVLIVPSGLRMGFIIGSMLIFIILGTFIYMGVTGTDLHRMSLGALIIAMGMMVDNSCFVADSMSVKMQRGMDRVKAAIGSASEQAWPLLGATVIATMAFYPIYASRANAGEYCGSLFTVVAASLVFSWFISMSLTPVMCVDLLPKPKAGAEGADPYGGAFFRGLRWLSTLCIRHRYITLLILFGLLASAVLNAGKVRQMFFPDASRNQLMIDYWAPEGARIQDVLRGVEPIEEWFMNDDRVESVSTFAGQGPPRFYLPVDPELPCPSYAQLVINTHDFEEIPGLATDAEAWLNENIPVLTRVRKYGVGPSDTWKLEARISGPAEADPATLRRLGDEGMTILRKSPLARHIRTEMRQPAKTIVPLYDQKRGRWATVTRQNLADATKRAYDGITVGLYREGDHLSPIILRHTEEERQAFAGGMDALQIKPDLYTQTVPLAQVTDGTDVVWEDPIIHRWNRRRCVTVCAHPLDGATFPSLFADVASKLEALELPPGYEIFWDGEYKSTVDAQQSLVPGLLAAGVVITLIIVLLYNSLRVTLCIFLVIPFAAIGIVYGLWLLDSPMGFVAILGVLSLAGMMIKNMIVITNAIRGGITDGLHPFEACVQASVSQARPIALAAGTTALGVIPLLPDPFWNAMAAAIMGGLGVGSVLTIILFPTLYATVHSIKPPPLPGPPPSPEAAAKPPSPTDL